MKQDTGKTNKKWIWIAVCAAILIAAAVLALLFLLPEGQEAEEKTDVKLYWNVDRLYYTQDSEVGLTTREPGEDGLYHVRFAVDGEQVELTVVGDRQLINYLDMMSVVALTMDTNGIVVDVIDPETLYTETASGFYVRSVQEDTLVINSSLAMNGMEQTVTLNENTGVYNVDEDAQVVGQKDQCQVMDCVQVFSNDAGQVTHVFITERTEKSKVYYRVDQHYDVSKDETTRVPDENGAYTFLFAVDGQQEELKCRDKRVASSIDSSNDAAVQMGLVFDEEGYIIDRISAASALQGKLLCNAFDITQIDGNTVTAERLMKGGNQGTKVTFALREDCDLFIVETGCGASFIGERVESLQMNDRIICYTDLENEAVLVYIIRRMATDATLYFNTTRMFSRGQTSRKPDANGYYVFEMAGNGGPVTLRTKDKAIASQVDSFGLRTVGLKTNGSIIEKVYSPECVCGWGALGQGLYVTDLSGVICNLTSSLNPDNQVNALISSDVKVYDVSGSYGVAYGSQTTLRLYDCVTAFRNISGEINYVFVTARYEENTKLYYNISRQYDNAAKQTKRVPGEDGYYVFDMICQGKQLTVKTKSKAMATFIDAQNAPIVALSVSNGIVRSAAPAIAAVKFGGKLHNTHYVKSVSKDGVYNTYYLSGEEKIDSVIDGVMAKDCVIYNVSTGYINYRGEKTSLQVGDRIQSFVDEMTDEVVAIFVLERKIASPLYWFVERKYNANTKETTRTPDAEGWYVIDLVVDGQIKQFKTKDKALASAVDARATAFPMYTKGDEIYQVYTNPTYAKGIRNMVAVSYDVTSINGNQAVVTRNRPTAEDYGATMELEFAKDCKFMDVSSYAENYGALTTLGVGDRIVAYINDDSQVVYCYITYKNTHTAGAVSYCEHCGKDVWWEPYSGSFYGADAHYYLTSDRSTKQLTIGSSQPGKTNYDIVLDLNGKTMSSEARNCLLYGKLSIMDTAGGGILLAAGTTGSGGNIYMEGGALNIYGGTLRCTGTPKNGGSIYAIQGAQVNLYGGKLEGNNAVELGGNLCISGSTFHMYGGTITGGTVSSNGGNLYAGTGAQLLLAGGTISGDVYINKAKITVSDSPVISMGSKAGLQMNDTLLTLGKLTEGASVVINANGIFTEAVENAEYYVNYFHPAVEPYAITVNQGALSCDKPTVNPNSIDNSPLAFRPGTTAALCPVCNEVVSWTALTGDGAINLQDGDHYYLAQDVTYEGTDIFLNAPGSNKTACIHLNNNDLTATAARVAQGNAGTLNIMGTGTVSGNFSSTSGNNVYRGAVLDINTTGKQGKIDLYGGTYVKPAENVNATISAYHNGGGVNIYCDAVIDGTNTTGCLIRSYNGQIGLYGGKILGGAGTVVAAHNWNETKSGRLGIYGGELIAGTGKAVDIIGCDTAPAAVTISGGTVNGEVVLNATGTLTLSGNPVISQLTVTDGALVTLGELTEGAAITVSANGTFSQPSENAQALAKYFAPLSPATKITVADNALVCRKDYLSDLAFAENTTKAYCPVCDTQVTWTALTQSAHGTSGLGAIAGDGEHYYLAESITYTGTEAFVQAPGSNKTACLHLNGKNITASNSRVIFGFAGVLNVMGTGTVSGNVTNANQGAAVHINTNNKQGAVNLYGGTYTLPQTNTTASAVAIWNNGGTVNIYEGATVDGDLFVGTANLRNATLTLQQGSITGKVTLSGANAAKGFASTFDIAGGSIGQMQVSGSNTVKVSGAPVIEKLTLAQGCTLTLGTLTQGAKVTVSASGAFTQACEQAADYIRYFSPLDPADTISEKENILYYTAANQ